MYTTTSGPGRKTTQVMGAIHHPLGYHYGGSVSIAHNCLLIAATDEAGHGVVYVYSYDTVIQK